MAWKPTLILLMAMGVLVVAHLLSCGAQSEKSLALREAVERGDVGNVADLLDNGGDVTDRGDSGRTLLHLAAEKRHRDMVALLLARGADVNAMDEHGSTALDKAFCFFRGGAEERSVVELLRAHGALFRTQIVITPLVSKVGHVLVFWGLTLAMPCVFVHIVRTGRFGRGVALVWLISGPGYLLMSVFPSVSINFDRSRLVFFPEGPIVFGMLVFGGWVWGLVISSLAIGTRAAIKHHWPSLLPGPVVFSCDETSTFENECRSGVTPLHKAAGQGDVTDAERLLQEGADVNATDKWGNNPLDIAEHSGHGELAQLLRTHGGKRAEELTK